MEICKLELQQQKPLDLKARPYIFFHCWIACKNKLPFCYKCSTTHPVLHHRPSLYSLLLQLLQICTSGHIKETIEPLSLIVEFWRFEGRISLGGWLGMNSDCLKTTPILLGKAASVITPAITSLNPVSRFTMLRNLSFGHCTSSTNNELRERQTQWRNKSRRQRSVAHYTDSFFFSFFVLFYPLLREIAIKPPTGKDKLIRKKQWRGKSEHTMQMK